VSTDTDTELGVVPPPNSDMYVPYWQGRIAAATFDGCGLDTFRAALESIKQNVPADRALLAHAQSEIWGAGERHLAESHGRGVLAEIYISVFSENPPGTEEDLDGQTELIDANAEINRLAKLPLIQYERQRKSAAEELRINRLEVLDKLVNAARSVGGTKGQGRPMELKDIEPWPDQVDGAVVLDAIASVIKRFVVLTDTAADAVALWCVATHAFDSFFIFPRLVIRSPTPRCGKTTLRDVVAEFVSRPLSADSISAAALFRTIEAMRPTLLLDEGETYLRDNEDMRCIVNSGHRKDGFVIKCVGDDHEPRKFSTWAPVLLALIGKPPATVYDRSVVITLRRKKPSEPVKQFRPKVRQELHALARKAAAWIRDNASRLAEPEALQLLNDRANDNWQPLLAIADAAGSTWPERARKAALALSENVEDDSTNVQLLHDLHWLLDGKPEDQEDGRVSREYPPTDKLFTRKILDELSKIGTSPWCGWNNGKGFSERDLAKALKHFQVAPETVRIGTETSKGYYAGKLREAFEAYLPAFTASATVTASQPSNDGHCDALQNVTNGQHVTFPETSQPNNDGHCDSVTLHAGVDQEETAWTL
jgi:hypothetical protein